MGLDWCLQSTEKGKSVLEYIGAECCDLSNPAHIDICHGIIKSHRDNIANDGGHAEYAKYWEQDVHVLLKKMEGQILVDTIDIDKYKEQLPNLGGMFACMSGIESFRGKRIGFCHISEETKERAYADMDPDEMLDYANELEEYIPDLNELDFDYTAEKTKADKLGMFEQDKSIPEDFWEYNTLKEAVEWLRFWAQYPIKMIAWY
jgi:hypothetical protein